SLLYRPPPGPPVFPSTTLFRSSSLRLGLQANGSASPEFGMPAPYGSAWAVAGGHTLRVFWLDVNNDSLLSTGDGPGGPVRRRHPDRKSTRLNSSHVSISYAVFC